MKKICENTNARTSAQDQYCISFSSDLNREKSSKMSGEQKSPPPSAVAGLEHEPAPARMHGTGPEPAISDQINLNVGGAFFSTTVGTLTMEKDSFFDLMVSGRFPIARDSENRVFIDRDGTHFRHILNFLRQAGKGWAAEDLGLSKAELKQLRQEADFYQMKRMVSAIDTHLAEISDHKNIAVAAVRSSDAGPMMVAIDLLLADGFTLTTTANLPYSFPGINFLGVDGKYDQWTLLVGPTAPSGTCLAALRQLNEKDSGLAVIVARNGRAFAISRPDGAKGRVMTSRYD